MPFCCDGIICYQKSNLYYLDHTKLLPGQLTIINSLMVSLEIKVLFICMWKRGARVGDHKCELTSEVFNELKYWSVFDDGFTDHVVGIRGRQTREKENPQNTTCSQWHL